jgi:hypothetical protein
MIAPLRPFVNAASSRLQQKPHQCPLEQVNGLDDAQRLDGVDESRINSLGLSIQFGQIGECILERITCSSA